MNAAFLFILLLTGCAVSPQASPDLNPARARTVTKQSFAQAAPESVTAPNPAKSRCCRSHPWCWIGRPMPPTPDALLMSIAEPSREFTRT